MKHTFTYIGIVAIALLSACSSNEEVKEQNSTLAELQTKRDSLKIEYNKIGKELKTLEKEIDVLDPSTNLYIVSAVKAQKKDFKHYVEIRGNVNSDQSISLFPEIGGLVNKVYVKEGQSVKKGQVLMKFDSEVLEKNRQEIDTALELAQTTYDKQKKLWDKNIGSEIQYLQAKTNLESMKSKKASLDAQISKTKITAPFSGIIDQIFIKEGELAAPSMPALRLINLDNVYIEAEVSEKYLRKIKKGTEANVYFPNLDQKIKAKVTMIGNYINSTNRTFRIVADIKNNEHKIKPNQIAIINLLDVEHEGVVIPANTLLNAPDGSSYVYTLVDENGAKFVRKVDVETGLSYNNETIVYKGLEDGTLVIDKGSRSVQEGQQVKVQ